MIPMSGSGGARRESGRRGSPPDPQSAFEAFATRQGPRIEEALRGILPGPRTSPRGVHRAMRYMVFPGGKRLRPLMVVLAHRTFGGRFPRIHEAAATVELIHTFSLIHDDLPCMDDDDFRRGRATCHKAFGEATAVLAGDALLVLAFETLGRIGRNGRGGRWVEAVAGAIGTAGVIGGQSLDLDSEGKRVGRDVLADIHRRKTAALFSGSLALGTLCAGAPDAAVGRAASFGESFGKAFQVADDLLNLEGSFREIGRPRGTDLVRRKATYPSVLGVEASYGHLRRFLREAVARAAALGGPAAVFEIYRGLCLKVARRVPGWTPMMERGLR